MTSPTPLFSVIIPVYNRAELVLRAIRSVLNDPATDVEVLVVDGASTDGTPDRVREVGDPRLRLVPSTPNDGQCAARNLGAREARGQWLIFLDSDDELVPGSLNAIRQRTQNAAPGVAKCLFSLRIDTGEVSPDPPFDGRVVDYIGFLKWAESTIDGRSETLPCTRRDAFLNCPYPEALGWSEAIHELNFVRNNKVQLCPEVVRQYHYDAPVRNMLPNPEMFRKRARGYADHAEAVLSGHGDAFVKYAPRRWVLLAREAALYSFFVGDRKKGIRHSVNLLRQVPTNTFAWITLVGGTVAPTLLQRVWSIRRARITV